MKKENTLDHVLKYTGVFGGVQGLTILMSVVRNKFASLFLGTVGIGLVGIYSSIGEFVKSISNLGIPFSAVRKVSELYEGGDEEALVAFIKSVRTWCLWTALGAVFITLACSPLLSYFFFDHDFSHWPTILLLSPMIMASILETGECAILKGTRRLKRVATVAVLCALTTLLLTVPFFWAWGTDGIIIALDLSFVAVLVNHLCYSLPLYPYRVALFSKEVLGKGYELIKVGVPYMLAAIAGSGVVMAINALLLKYGTEEDLGLYRVGYAMMVTYAGIVFTAFEADFFPRLSGVNHQLEERNLTINQQIRVSLLLISPLLVGMMMLMPVLIPLLSTAEFLPATNMAICAAFYMFFRSITTPISYTALACGDSKLYLLMEVIYDAVSLALIIGCFVEWGLTGAGIGLSLSALFDLMMIGCVYGKHYKFRITRSTLMLAVVQGLCIAVSMYVCIYHTGLLRYGLASVVLAASTYQSYSILSRETSFVAKLKAKFHKEK